MKQKRSTFEDLLKKLVDSWFTIPSLKDNDEETAGEMYNPRGWGLIVKLILLWGIYKRFSKERKVEQFVK